MSSEIIKVRIREEADITRVRQVADRIARSLKFERFARTRCITASLEIARNIVQYAGSGSAIFRLYEDNRATCLGVRFIDQGPGIDPNAKRDDGKAFFSHDSSSGGKGLGLGLSGARRLADEYDIDTGPEGTCIDLGFKLPPGSGEIESLCRLVADDLAALTKADPVVELSRQNRELAEALSERELLIAEVHHRTGNNLALVSSIIQMASRKATTDEAKQLLAETESRIHSIIQVHQDLQSAQGFDEIDALPFFRSIGENSVDAFSHVGKDIDLEVSGLTLSLPSALIADLGLMVGELITNAVKHAFPDRSSGKIRIELEKDDGEVDDGERYLLVFSDDGVGLAEGQRPERSSSLGWRMIRSIASRHDAVLSIDGADGLEVRLSFAI